MSEETSQTQPTPNNADDGSKSETNSIVERIDSSIKRLEETEKRLNEKMTTYEQILARNLISGRSEAGSSKKPLTDDEKAIEESKLLLRGTGLDPFK